MAPQTPQRGESELESSSTMGAESITPLVATQIQDWHHLVHRNAANAATENLTLDALLKTVFTTGSSKDQKQDAIGCECCRVEVDGCQQMM